jgi:hypothetical protein
MFDSATITSRQRLRRFALAIAATLLVAVTSLAAARAASVDIPRGRMTLGDSRAPLQSVSRDASRCSTFSGPRLYASTYRSDYMFVAVLDAEASGDTKPLCELLYSGFGNAIGGLALGAAKNLWVLNSAAPSLMAFGHAANGNQPPLRTIGGANTLLVQFPFGNSEQIATDRQGNAWVPVWYDYNQRYGYITAYANDRNGNVPPIATIGYGDKGQAEGIGAPAAVAFDRHGNLYVGQYGTPGNVVIFSPPFLDTSKPVAMWTLPGLDDAQYLAIDHHDTVYVAGNSSLDVFNKGLKSHGMVSRRLVPPRGESRIAGLATDAQDNLYVSSVFAQKTIRVYAPNAASWGAAVRNIRSTSAFRYGYPMSLAVGS